MSEHEATSVMLTLQMSLTLSTRAFPSSIQIDEGTATDRNRIGLHTGLTRICRGSRNIHLSYLELRGSWSFTLIRSIIAWGQWISCRDALNQESSCLMPSLTGLLSSLWIANVQTLESFDPKLERHLGRQRITTGANLPFRSLSLFYIKARHYWY